MRAPKFNMDDILQDKVSGFKGQVQGITFYATGCLHYGLASNSLKPDGDLLPWQWFDESRLVMIAPANNAVSIEPTSGPDMNPTCY